MSCELSIDQLAEIAVDVVRVGMAIALDPPCDLAVDTKSNRNDLVTAVDRAIEEEIAARLEEATGLPLLGGRKDTPLIPSRAACGSSTPLTAR